MAQDPVSVAKAVFQAFIDKDREAIERLIADDFAFTSPVDNKLSRETYFERCWPNSEDSKSFDYIYAVADGERAFITYESESDGGHKFRNTEILTVKDGKVTAVEVYFGWDVPHEAEEGGFLDDDYEFEDDEEE